MDENYIKQSHSSNHSYWTKTLFLPASFFKTSKSIPIISRSKNRSSYQRASSNGSNRKNQQSSISSFISCIRHSKKDWRYPSSNQSQTHQLQSNQLIIQNDISQTNQARYSPRRLSGIHRSDQGLFTSSYQQNIPKVPVLSPSSSNLQIQGSTIRTGISTKIVHQSDQHSDLLPKNARNQNFSLSRRSINKCIEEQHHQTSKHSHQNTTQTRIVNQHRQIRASTDSKSILSRNSNQLKQSHILNSSQKTQQNQQLHSESVTQITNYQKKSSNYHRESKSPISYDDKATTTSDSTTMHHGSHSPMGSIHSNSSNQTSPFGSHSKPIFSNQANISQTTISNLSPIHRRISVRMGSSTTPKQSKVSNNGILQSSTNQSSYQQQRASSSRASPNTSKSSNQASISNHILHRQSNNNSSSKQNRMEVQASNIHSPKNMEADFETKYSPNLSLHSDQRESRRRSQSTTRKTKLESKTKNSNIPISSLYRLFYPKDQSNNNRRIRISSKPSSSKVHNKIRVKSSNRNRRSINSMDKSQSTLQSSIQAHSTSSSQSQAREHINTSIDSLLANQTFLSQFSQNANRHSDSIQSSKSNIQSRQLRSSSKTSQLEDNLLSYLIKVGAKTSLSKSIVEQVVKSVTPKTFGSYSKAWKDFVTYCRSTSYPRPNQLTQENISQLALQYLNTLHSKKKRITQVTAALNFTCRLVFNLDLHDNNWISRLIKTNRKLLPYKPKYMEFYDLKNVINYLESKPKPKDATLEEIRSVVVGKLACYYLLRKSDIYKIFREDIVKKRNQITLYIRGPKEDQHSLKPVTIFKPKSNQNNKSKALFYYIRKLLNKTKAQRLIPNLVSPGKSVADSTIAGYISEILKQAGVDKSYKPHSLRGAATNYAALHGIQTEAIKACGRWASNTAMERYYLRTQVNLEGLFNSNPIQ